MPPCCHSFTIAAAVRSKDNEMVKKLVCATTNFSCFLSIHPTCLVHLHPTAALSDPITHQVEGITTTEIETTRGGGVALQQEMKGGKTETRTTGGARGGAERSGRGVEAGAGAGIGATVIVAGEIVQGQNQGRGKDLITLRRGGNVRGTGAALLDQTATILETRGVNIGRGVRGMVKVSEKGEEGERRRRRGRQR